MFERPRHPYTRALLDACPRYDRPKAGAAPRARRSDRAPARRGGGALSADLLVARNIARRFRRRAAPVRRAVAARRGPEGRQPPDRARRNGWHRRRIRFRQNHARPRPASARGADRGKRGLRRARHHASARSGDASAAAADAADLSGPAGVASTRARRFCASSPSRCCSMASRPAGSTRRRRRARSSTGSACPPRASAAIRTNSPAASASASASRAPRCCARFPARRRDRLRPRRLDPGAGAEPHRRPVARPRPRHGLHQPRPLGDPRRVRSRLCAPARRDRRGRSVRDRLRRAEARVHARADRRDSSSDSSVRTGFDETRPRRSRRDERGAGGAA